MKAFETSQAREVSGVDGADLNQAGLSLWERTYLSLLIITCFGKCIFMSMCARDCLLPCYKSCSGSVGIVAFIGLGDRHRIHSGSVAERD
jgi:hypothetical protein